MRVLVTGANGFVGRAVCHALAGRGHSVVRALRAKSQTKMRLHSKLAAVEDLVVGEIGLDTEWRGALNGVDAIIHLAARVHVMDRTEARYTDYRSINVGGTARLAECAAAAGTGRIVFVSTVKVHGEVSAAAIRPSDESAPTDPYGLSKWEAEHVLRLIGDESPLEVTIVRPPLVYGPGVRANFLRLFRAVDRGVPMPFGAVRNRRSLVYVGNLADALVSCAESPAAAGETFLVSDGNAPSTPELIRSIAHALGRPARLPSIPPALLMAVARVLGKGAELARLCESLEVDDTAIRARLNWAPPFTLAQGLAATARWFREAEQSRGNRS